jgi:acetolactate synthase-1/2/3 large subunit
VKVYEGAAQALIEAGVDRLFGVMGDANMRMLADFMDRRPGAYVAAAHEAGAVTMADGYSRLAGRVGVASLTHGPGLTNAMTALTNAVRAHSQLVVLTGSTPPQREHIQEFDLRALAQAAGADYRRTSRPEFAVDDLLNAMRSATLRRQPVVLDIPLDQAHAPLTGYGHQAGPGPWAVERTRPAEDRLDEALGVLLSADRPLILAGRGAVLSGARDELTALSEALAAPLATTVLARSYFAGHPLDLGIFGAQAHSLATKYIAQADCVLVLGAGLNMHTTASGDLVRGKALVQCDIDPGVAGSRQPTQVSVTADVRTFAQSLLAAVEQVGERPERSWTERARAELAEFDPAADFDDQGDDEFVDIRTAMVTLDRLLPADRALVTDAGHFMTAPWRHLGCTSGAFAHSGSFGAIGLGLGTATGAAFAQPGRLTVAVVGDGGLMMSLQELAVSVAHRLPLLIVVANDGCYSAEYRKLTEYGQNPEHSLLAWPSFAAVARAFGAEGEVVRSIADLGALKARLQDIQTPLLLDLRTDPAKDCRNYK